MRTLKKTLCLVLCLAMMVGLCAFGVHADFTDADEIKNKEAVDLMAGIGVIEGYPDESYQPTKIFNRAEAAKIIAYLLLGKEGAEALPKADTQFSDVTYGHWASGYIAYCAQQGIIAGKGHGLFGPADELTAEAWAKMLLCALGYSADIEGLTGADWSFNVTRLVSKTKLADGMAFSGKTPMSRDNAALLAYNALTVPMVEYVNGVSVGTADGTTVTVNATLQRSGEYLAEKFDLVPDYGPGKNGFDKLGLDPLTANYGVITDNDFTMVPAEGITCLNGAPAAAGYDYATSEELYGHYVKVQEDEDGEAVAITDLGTYVDVAKATTDAKTFKAAFGFTAAKYTEGVGVYPFFLKDGKVIAALGVADGYDPANGIVPKGVYVFNEDNEVVAIILRTAETYLSAVTKVDTKGEVIKLKNGAAAADLELDNSEDNDEVAEYEGIAAKDIVLVTVVGDQYKLAKAEKVTGAITKVAEAAGGKKTVTIDGVEYAQSANADKSGLGKKYPSAADMKAGAKYSLYLDGEGKYIACVPEEEEAEPVNALYVVAVNPAKKYTGEKVDGVRQIITVVDATGAQSDIIIDDDQINTGAGQVAVVAPGVGTFVTAGSYKTTDTAIAAKLNAAGIKKVEALNAGVAAANQTVWGEATNLTLPAKLQVTDKDIAIASGKAYVNASTVYVFIDNYADFATVKAEAKTGPQNFDAAAQGNVLYSQDKAGNKIATAVFFNVKFADAGLSANDLIYFAPKAYKSTDGTGYTYTVYNVATGETKEILTKGNAADAFLGFYKYSTSGDYTSVAATDYKADNDTSIFVNRMYAGRYGTNMHVGAYDVTADTNTKIVDIRPATNDDYDGDLETVADLDAALAAFNIKYDMFVNEKKAVTVIFVKEITAKPAA